MKKKNFIYGFLTCLLVLIISGAIGYKFLKGEREEMLLEENSQEITTIDYSIIKLEKNDLETIGLKDIANAKISFASSDFIFINFWATWCMPCVAELPSIKLLKEGVKDNRKSILFVFATDQKVEEVMKFEEKKGFNFQYGFYEKGKVPSTFKNDMIPATFIIDKKNGICYKISGSINYDSDVFKRFFKSILN